MNPGLFFLYTGTAVLAAVIAFLPLRQPRTEDHSAGDQRPVRFKALLTIGTLIGFLPLVTIAVFSRVPLLPVKVLPVSLWAAVGREYWFPLAVLFFACASQMVPRRSRRALLVLVGALVLFVGLVTSWHLTRPACYDYRRNMPDGVCLQTSTFTCGAASMVTMLDKLGIQATEGEMAELSGTIPGRGVSDFQAADALRRKLRQVEDPRRVSIDPCGLDEMKTIPTPFLTSLKYSFFFDHMVCVLEVNEDHIVVGDPLKGRDVLSFDSFRSKWRGVVIVARP